MTIRALKSALLYGCALIAANDATAQEALPRTEPAPAAITEPSRDKTAPSWPQNAKARAGAPNIVLVLLDDAGFGATSTFGGAAQTPSLDRLAREGLRYNAFHVSALCSPTRASLLSGRTDHQVGFGSVADAAAGAGFMSTDPPSRTARSKTS